MAQAPVEANELRLLNNVELRIALADSDTKLQSLLNLYLPAILLKLGSPHAAVHKKVGEICSHINTRIKSTSFLLPVPALLQQFQDPAAGGAHPLIRNVDLIYISMGIDRMPVSERLELLPTLLKDISTHGTIHQRTLFNVILRLLQHYKPPMRGNEEDTALREKLFGQDVSNAKWLASRFSKLMLLGSITFGAESEVKESPGLSREDMEFLTLKKKETFTPYSVLTDSKVAALKFLSTGAFTDEERFYSALIATTDGNSTIADPAEDIFKRAIAGISLEDEEVVSELYGLMLGRYGIPAAKFTLQMKILGLLSKSKTATKEVFKKQIEDTLALGLRATDNKRLEGAVFFFMAWVARMSDNALIDSLAPGVVEKLRYWLLFNPHSEEAASGGMRASETLWKYAYETLALFASRCVRLLLEPEIEIISSLFKELDNDKKGFAAVIEDALGVILTRLSMERIHESVKSSIETMLLRVVLAEGRAVMQAVKWSNRLLGFGNVTAKWISLLSIKQGGSIAEEGSKALHPYSYRLVNPEASIKAIINASEMDIDQPEAEDKFAFPKFASLVQYFRSMDTHREDTFTETQIYKTLGPNPFAAALPFLKRIAIWEAIGTQHEGIKVDEDWDRNVDTILETDETSRSMVEAFFQQQDPEVVAFLLDMAWEAMINDGEASLDPIRGIWSDIAALVHQDALARYAEHLPTVLKLITSPKTETRHVSAQSFGLLGSSPVVDNTTLGNVVISLVAGVSDNKSGFVLAFGYLLSRMQMRGRMKHVDTVMLQKGLELIATLLSTSRDGVLIDAATEAICELSVFNVIQKDMIDIPAAKKTLLEKSKKGHEKSVQTLGSLGLLYAEGSSEIEDIIKDLITLGETGGVEMSFVVGEALSTVAAGWGSSAVRRRRHINGVDWASGRRDGVKEMLDLFLKRANESAGGGKRRATVVGLLSILEFCTGYDTIKERLTEAQLAFRMFLTDRDDFIQESAARGLTAVYGLSDESTQRELVRALVSSFTGETKQKIQVSRDTQLFEPGQLPTGDGSSVGSYGDIMSLAAELGDPSLVYKFMSLARHNSLWTSRAAFGRFGLQKILSSSVEVRDNAKLWPVLYRYRFDPSTGVRQSMESIWQALGGGSETVERWWEDILRECLKSSLRGSEWRVREASIAAMADLLGGRKVSQYKQYLQEIWVVAFKVLDDVKESVRVAAMKLCKTLTTGMVRALEGDTGPKETAEILTSLMEFLMGRQGLEAEAQDVQMFALHTLLKVVKSAGEKLRPWIPDLLHKMLVLLAEVEPEAVNYLIMNADKYKTTGEDIDRMRLTSIRHSPIMSAIEDILDNLDEASMTKLVPTLTKSLRTFLSLPSKAGCSRVIVSLVMRHPTLFKPYADNIGKSLLGVVNDRSEVVSASYAIAVGYASRLATDEGLLNTVKWCKDTYWSGEEKERRVAGAIISAIYKHATDRANSLAVDILPFIFIAKNDMDASVAEEFSKTWSDNTGGSGAVKLYLNEIVQLSKDNISSARWATKQTCSLALAEAAKALSRDATVAQVEIIWSALVTATAIKSWEGKEKVLESFVTFAVDAKPHLLTDSKRIAELEKIMTREAKRNNATYRGPAINCLGIYAAGFPESDLFDSAFDIVTAAISPDDEDEMDVDGKDGHSSKQLQQATVVHCLTALARCWRPSKTNEANAIKQLESLLAILDKQSAGANIALKSCIISSITIATEHLASSDVTFTGVNWDKSLQNIFKRIDEHLHDQGYETGRDKSVAALSVFVDVLERYKSVVDGSRFSGLVQSMNDVIQTRLREENSSVVRQVLVPVAAKIASL